LIKGTEQDAKFKSLLKISKKDEKKVIKVQAVIRGYLSRKVNALANDMVDPRP